MRAALLEQPAPIETSSLMLRNVPVPSPMPGEVLLKVLACGICHTDLHIAEGDLPPIKKPVILGHQIVGEVMKTNAGSSQIGDRVGIAWLGGTDGTCRYCRTDRENLCDHPVFTGYSRDGGFAEYVAADARFTYPIPENLPSETAAPLLCAGAVGYRSLRVAEVKPGTKVGLFGYGASAQMVMPVLLHWGCEVFVSTREPDHQELALTQGARWAGPLDERAPEQLDAAITFAPVGHVVISALRSLSKGGIVAINAVHLDRIPSFDYDTLLWGERQLRSVANLTRKDAADYLQLISNLSWRPKTTPCHLEEVNRALLDVRESRFTLPYVIIP
ncbi:zinc-dependent alcohol dehydrogenase family protein [Terriglobus albidus]|uniref:zinc-dependent alcohol dehydrogenase family protein n=1 Tax=Terriglobus albidus TaxID=1592106 RepID=UPI0021E0BB1F|nr:zinc-dependent alcohol dehydrogenase family protein [Terriglobus albidus]